MGASLKKRDMHVKVRDQLEVHISINENSKQGDSPIILVLWQQGSYFEIGDYKKSKRNLKY